MGDRGEGWERRVEKGGEGSVEEMWLHWCHFSPNLLMF